MKKQVLIVMVVLVLIVLTTGCVTMATAKTFSEVVEVEGKSSNEIYIAANQWAVETFKSAKSVIQFSDKESGVVSGRYATSGMIGLAPATIYSVINIEVKDGRYRLTISDPYYETTMQYASSGVVNQSAPLSKLYVEWDRLAASLKAYVIKGSGDW